MVRPFSAILPVLLFASVLAGCAHHRCTCEMSNASDAGENTAPLPPETRKERGNLCIDLSAVDSYESVDKALGQPPAAEQYRVVKAEQVQCLAAANAPFAKLFAGESEAAASDTGHHHSCSSSTMSTLMAYRTVDQRNKAAGMALELFYSLTEAEAGRDILERCVEEVDLASTDLDDLKKSGLKIPMDRTALQRQKLDWLDRQIQLQSAARQIQGQLRQICGLEEEESTLLWPEADLKVTIVPLDVKAAIEEGLENRADVGALQMLDESLSVDTLPAVRSGMQMLNVGLGASVAGRRLFGGGAGSAEELQTRQSQLTQALEETERTARREIREAAENVESRLREIAVAKSRRQAWKQRLTDLKEKRTADGTTAFDVRTAKLEMLRAESEVLHRVIAWRIAQVKLRQAQGLLAVDCGYHLPENCE